MAPAASGVCGETAACARLGAKGPGSQCRCTRCRAQLHKLPSRNHGLTQPLVSMRVCSDSRQVSRRRLKPRPASKSAFAGSGAATSPRRRALQSVGRDLSRRPTGGMRGRGVSQPLLSLRAIAKAPTPGTPYRSGIAIGRTRKAPADPPEGESRGLVVLTSNVGLRLRSPRTGMFSWKGPGLPGAARPPEGRLKHVVGESLVVGPLDVGLCVSRRGWG